MIKDKIGEKVSQWSLDRVQFMLAHMEGFIEDDEQALRENARHFVAQTGLEKIERLIDLSPNDPSLPVQLFEKLAIYFSGGALIERSTSPEQNANWWATHLFWRGLTFQLALNDQVQANSLIPEMTPLQVHKAQAEAILDSLNLRFLAQAPETHAYLLKPTPTVSYLLLSELPAPWAMGHLENALRLVNKAFVF